VGSDEDVEVAPRWYRPVGVDGEVYVLAVVDLPDDVSSLL